MNTHKISVIVPVYKVEPYLDRCVKSIVDQTYKNIEIILIDDGSPDRCPQMCDEWAKKDERIIVHHKPNGGVSSARNLGLDKATGDYVAFVDSDDFITPDYIETLYNMCVTHDCDIAQCDLVRVYNDEIVPCTAQDGDVIIYDNIQMLDNLYSEIVFTTIITMCKLYKKRLFDDIRYPLIKIGEDEAVIHKIIYGAKKIAVTNKKMYMYYHSPDSATRTKKYCRDRLIALDTFEERIRFFDEKGLKDIAEKTVSHHCIGIILSYNKSKKYIPDCQDVPASLMDKYKCLYKRAVFQKSTSIKDKIRFILYRIFPLLPTWIGNKYAQ